MDGRTDGRTDRQTDGGDYNIPFAFLKKRGDNKITLNHQCHLYKISVYLILISPLTMYMVLIKFRTVVYTLFILILVPAIRPDSFKSTRVHVTSTKTSYKPLQQGIS